MTTARLLVSYTEGSNSQVTFGMDIANYDRLSASEILMRINERIANHFYGKPHGRIIIQNVIELSPKVDRPVQTPMTDKGYSHECLACGKENGHGGLMCPTMSPS